MTKVRGHVTARDLGRFASSKKDQVEKGVTREGNDPTPESAWIIMTLVSRPS